MRQGPGSLGDGVILRGAPPCDAVFRHNSLTTCLDSDLDSDQYPTAYRLINCEEENKAL